MAFGAAFAFGAPHLLAQETQPAPQEAPPAQGTPPPAAEGQPPPELDLTERQFQDWVLRCGKSQQGPEVCEMQQQRTDKEGRTVMAVAVGTVPGQSDLGLLIILPLGIALPPGVTLQIDGGGEVPLVVDRCERQGCRIEMLIKPDRVEVKRGEQVKFVLRNAGKTDHEFMLDSVANNAKHKIAMEKNPDMEHDDPNGKRLTPDGSSEIVWRFTKPGTFEFACLIPGHYESGMHGTIVVK